MSRRHAPLVLRAHELAAWLSRHAPPTPPRYEGAASLWVSVLACSRRLLVELGIALTFPGRRDRARDRADLRTLELRTLLRLAADLGVLDGRQFRFAARATIEIGKMIGGWKRAARVRRQRESADRVAGPAAVIACSVAAATGTTRTGAARRRGTGTSPATGTTGSVSVSPSPPPRTRDPEGS